jgi:hypothetical protein
MQPLTDDSPMPYGKFQGTKMANVPAWYLIFLRENNRCTIPVKQYIKQNYDVLQNELAKSHKK